MKIFGRLPNLAQIYGQQQSKAEQKKNAQEADRDRAEISSDAKEIRRLVDKAGQLPEIRTELVDKIKSKIAEGSYNVDSQQLAAKIIENLKDENND